MNSDMKGEWQGVNRKRKHREGKKKRNLTKKENKKNPVTR